MSPLLIALGIFALRCIDVTLGTLRLILTVQGRRTPAAAIAFVEVSIFITAVASVVSAPLSPLRVFAYGGGFAAGTFLGVTLDRRLGIGKAIVRVITVEHERLIERLTGAGFGVTAVEGRGGRGSSVWIMFSVASRRRVQELLDTIREIDPDAITSVQEVRSQYHGYFAPRRPGLAVTRPLD